MFKVHRLNLLKMWLLVVCLFPSGVQAKSLISLLPQLLNTHEEIKAAEARRDQARFQITAARGGNLPKLDISVNGGREWVNSVAGVDTSENRNKESFRLTQLLADFGSTKSLVDRSEAIFERTKVDLKSARQDVLLKGILAYLGIIKAREKLVYAKESEASIVKQTGMEETIVEHGAGLSSDILQTKSQLSRARALRVSVEGELLIALNRFKAVFYKSLSEDEIKSFVMPGVKLAKIPESIDKLVVYASENNPRLQSDKLNVIVAGHEIYHSRARYFPKFNLYAEGAHRENDLGALGIRNEVSVGAEINYNLFNGFIDRASLRVAGANKTEKMSILQNNTRIIEENARNAWQNYLTSKEKHKYLKDQVAIVGEFLKLARKERKLGTRSLLDVLSGEFEYINAVSQSVSAEVETMEAVYKIFYSMGILDIDVL